MASKTTSADMSSCAAKHPKIFFKGATCPACKLRTAGLAIAIEYSKVQSICQALIERLTK